MKGWVLCKMNDTLVVTVQLTIVARVLALACTNEYLLRTMDSLVAVQRYMNSKAITELKTKFKHSWSKNSGK